MCYWYLATAPRTARPARRECVRPRTRIDPTRRGWIQLMYAVRRRAVGCVRAAFGEEASYFVRTQILNGSSTSTERATMIVTMTLGNGEL